MGFILGLIAYLSIGSRYKDKYSYGAEPPYWFIICAASLAARSFTTAYIYCAAA